MIFSRQQQKKPPFRAVFFMGNENIKHSSSKLKVEIIILNRMIKMLTNPGL